MSERDVAGTRERLLLSGDNLTILGFYFPGVIPNQKYLPRSLKLYFDEERSPILGSLKNSSFVESPNFLHRKLKMLGIEFRFYKEMRPSMESQPSILLLMGCGERPKK